MNAEARDKAYLAWHAEVCGCDTPEEGDAAGGIHCQPKPIWDAAWDAAYTLAFDEGFDA